MTQIEELLRGALTDTATPSPTITDPLADLERRIGRARLRLGSIAVAVVAAIVAAIVVPLSILGSTARTPVVSRPSVEHWPGRADQIVSGGGWVWTLTSTFHHHVSRSVIQQRDPDSGLILRTFPVPAPQPGPIYYGLGRVWVTNGGEAPVPTVTVAALDPATGSVATAKLGAGNPIASSITFAAGKAWVVSSRIVYQVEVPATGDQLTATTVSGHTAAYQLLAVPQVATDEILVWNGGKLTTPISLTGQAEPVSAYRPTWRPAAHDEGNGVWAVKGHTVIDEYPVRGRPAIRSTVHVPGRVLDVAADPTGGLYVTLVPDGPHDSGSSSVWYFAADALTRENPQPSAELDGRDVASVIVDPAGGAVVSEENGAVYRWTPNPNPNPKTPAPAGVPVSIWKGSVVTGPASGAGFAWTLATTTNGVHRVVQRRDPATGAVLQTYRVPDSEQFLAFGLGRVWAWGGGDGAYPDGQISTIAPGSGFVRTLRLGRGNGLDTSAYGYTTDSALGFAGGRAFGARENGGGVIAIDPTDLSASRTPHAALDVGADTVLGGDGTIYVLGTDRVLGQWPATGHWPPSGASQPVDISGFPLAADANVVWAVKGSTLVREDTRGEPIGSPIPIPRVSRARFLPTPISVAVDTVGGLYVGLPRPGPAGNSLLYYSTVALSSAHPTPTAVGRADRVDKITADPAGGVVVVSGSLDDGSAKVGWWNPVAS